MKIRKALSLVLAFLICIGMPLTVLAEEPAAMADIQAPQREIINIDNIIDSDLNVDFEQGNTVTYRGSGDISVQNNLAAQNRISNDVINLEELQEFNVDNLPEAKSSLPSGIKTATVDYGLIPETESSDKVVISDEGSSVEVPNQADAISNNDDNLADNPGTNKAQTRAVTNTAPVADLFPIILNEESLVNGQITTETQIAWLWDSYDPDGGSINHYVAGIDNKYILGILSGNIGFVTQFTDPGQYTLYYYCIDSNNEMSNVVSYNINVISGQEEYFMGQVVTSLPYTQYYNISSPSDLNYAMNYVFNYATGTSNPTTPQVFGVDMPTTKSILSVIQNTGNGSLTVEVYDSNENLVGSVVTTDNSKEQNIHTKNELVLDGHAAGRYYFVVTGATSQYRFLVGDESNFEYYRQGYQNRTQIGLYKDFVFGGGASATTTRNSVVGYPTQRLVEEYYEFTADGITTITLSALGTFMRFAVYDPALGGIVYDSSQDPNALRTKWGNANRTTYKARLGTTSGKKYDVIIYNTNPSYGAYQARNNNQYIWGLYVGEPLGAMSAINPVNLTDVRGSISVTKNTSTTAQFFLNYSTSLPNTAVLLRANMSLGGSMTISNDQLYNYNFPSTKYYSGLVGLHTVWFEETKLSHSNSTPIYGNWLWTFKPGATGTVTPTMQIQYAYEIGD